MDWFLPGYKAGGPIRSVANMIRALSEDFDFFIVTRNTDLSDDEPYKNIEPNKWLTKYSAHVYYLSADNYSKDKIKTLIGERNYDAMYLNSLYSSQYALTPLRIRNKDFPDLKTVLAPRGMLGAGALQKAHNCLCLLSSLLAFAKKHPLHITFPQHVLYLLPV